VLHLIQKFRASGETLDIQELHEIINMLEWQHNHKVIDEIISMVGNISVSKLYQYVIKQYKNDSKAYYAVHSVLYTWRDYLKECMSMNVSVKNTNIAFPKSVHALHQRQIERKKAIADAKLNSKFKKRARELSSLCFEYNGLHVRPVKSTAELTYEGEFLHHCVADYAKSHANGETSILVIRKNEEPETPFFTLEINENNRIRQISGMKNCRPTDEVEAFLEAFKGTEESSIQATG